MYICNVAFRSNSRGHSYPSPVVVSYSTDGGDTWKTKQVTSAKQNASGCTVRTDSNGVVYLFYTAFGLGTPGIGSHMMVKSLNGGLNWSRPQAIFSINDACYNVDPVIGRCVEDGIAGARMDLTSAPSVDIANGAPTGEDATNLMVDTWSDGRFGLNNEKVMISASADSGATWSAPAPISTGADRGYYTAAGISPNGTDVYVVYNAFTTPYRDNTTDPRGLVGVVLHSDIAGGVPGPFTELNRGAVGDPRASSQNDLAAEFLGDYVYAVATRTYGAGVWNDVRNGADCPAIDAWRMALRTGAAVARPAPQQDCPATFGNTDIYGGSYADPTP